MIIAKNKLQYYILSGAIFLMLGACTGTLVDGPSLNKRPFEISLSEMRELAGKESALGDSTLTSGDLDIDDLLSQLGNETRTLWQDHKRADEQFSKRADNIAASVNNARGSAFGSERWSVAQMSLSRLDRLRAPSLTSLTKVDALVFTALESQNNATGANQTDEGEPLSALLQLQKMMETDVLVQSRYLDGLNNILAQ